ncbi:hypothetical protein TrLO_g8105 [Triparma laevis f. longispina]|uniref:Neurotransmitter-gated ion-channel transmembrane domain-containing protein n=1 Tax=Triparma laevis f. longispina TaxID=1714387 RepID=A0A9W7E675_9STRA|nr:hypothetical protein TrLO_g8105 [Triparma laevis f. longispina]
MFPLDSDSISISVGPKDETVDKCILKIDPKKHGFENAQGDRIKKSNVAEWTVDVPDVRLGLSGPTGSGNYYSNIEFCIMVHRNFLYYVWKVLAIVYLLILSLFVIFVMDPVEEFGDRISIVLTLFLAVCFFVCCEALPKVPYLTLLDKLMLLAFCFIFLGGLETVIARFHSFKVDEISLWLFPTVYFSINLYYLGKGLRYRFLLINDKDSEAYKAQTNMESTMKHVKENETSSSSTSLGSKVDEDEIEVSSIELKNIS